jgi:lysophospholipase L1-like esterase
LFQNPKIKNRGIGGDETDGVLLRLEEIIKSLPEKIFIMIWINDLSHLGIDQVVTNYKKIIEKIKSQSPNTKIYIQSILPVNNKFYSAGARNNDIIKLNQILKNLNQTTRDWHTRPVILREAKGLAARFFAALKMTLPKGRVPKCTNVIGFDLASLNDIISVDLFSLMSKSNNQLDEKYSNDGIHLNGQAYLVWKSAIEKYVN